MQGIPWALKGLSISGNHYKFLWKTRDPYTIMTTSCQCSNPAKTQPASYQIATKRHAVSLS